MGYDVVHTREPGGIEIAEKIRDIILDPQNVMMDAKTEALLYAASRRQHLVEKVIPSIEDGKVVLCERFVDSSLAYQGYGRELGFDEVLSINKFAIGDYFPDMTVLKELEKALKEHLICCSACRCQQTAKSAEDVLMQKSMRMGC